MKLCQTAYDMKANPIPIIAGLVLFGLLGMVFASFADEGEWEVKASSDFPRFSHSASVVDEKIYLFGGLEEGPPAWTMAAKVETYDPATDTWEHRTNIPGTRNAACSSVVDGIIYVIGGAFSFSKVEAYDPATDTWERKAGMPTERMFFSTSVVDGKIYAIGGSKGTLNGFAAFATVEAYDPATDTWERKASIPTARTMFSTSVVNGKIYAIGGLDGGGLFPTVEEYDPATDKWEQKSDMHTARFALSSSTVNGKIYAMGGAWGGLSTVEVYDSVTDKWAEAEDMPTGRTLLSSSVVNGKIYAIGGGPTVDLNFPEALVEAFDPEPGESQSVNPAGKLPVTWGEVKNTADSK